jgi:chromosome segregation ATPase
MDLEQLHSRLEWLDEERRKDRTILVSLEERLKGVAGELTHLQAQLKAMEDYLAAPSSLAERLTQFEQTLAQQRIESGRQVAELEKQVEALRTTEATHYAELDGVRKSIAQQLRKSLDARSLRHELQARVEEEERLQRELVELKQKVEAIAQAQEEMGRTQQVIEEGQRQGTARLTDLQGDILATRKRLDSVRETITLNTDAMRRLESRLNELLASEAERRQAQTEFLENQARWQVERERIWKEWEQHFEALARQSGELEAQLRAWEVAQRAIKRAQETYEEILQKFERRIHEMVEMQRLAEDRARQEWAAFRAEDQKRWANYTLAQEETLNDLRSEIERLETRLAAVEDLAQTQQDILLQTKEANEQMLHALLAQIHDLLSAYERILGVIQPGHQAT